MAYRNIVALLIISVICTLCRTSPLFDTSEDSYEQELMPLQRTGSTSETLEHISSVLNEIVLHDDRDETLEIDSELGTEIELDEAYDVQRARNNHLINTRETSNMPKLHKLHKRRAYHRCCYIDVFCARAIRCRGLFSDMFGL